MDSFFFMISQLEELKGWVHSDDLWEFIHVIQCLIFERGENPENQLETQVKFEGI